MATSIDTLLRAAGNVEQSSASLAAKRQEVAKANEDDVLAYIDAVSRVSIAQRDQAKETDAMAMALDSAKAGIMEVRGGPARLQEDLKKVMDQGAALETHTAELVRKSTRSIFDIISDPIGVVKDYVTLDDTKAQVDGATKKLQASRTALQATHQTVVESVTQLETTRPTITAALAQARQEQLLAASQAQIAQARIEGRKHGIDGYKAAVDADLSTLQVMGTVRGAMVQEEHLRLQREATVAASEERNIRLTMLKLQQADLKKREDMVAFYKDTLARGMSSIGLKPPEGPGMDILAEQAMKDPNSEAARNFNRGMMQMSVPGAGNRIAPTAWDALNTIKNDTVNLPPETQAVQKVLQDAEAILQGSAAKLGLDAKKNPQAFSAAYEDAVKQVLANEFADVRTDVPGLANPFPNLGTYVMASPTLANLPITKKFLKPMIDQGISLSNPAALMKQGVAAVQAGTLTSGEFIVGMNLIATGAVAQHQALSRASDFGLIPPTSLNVRLPVYRGPFGNSRLVNLTSPSDLSKYFAEQTPFQTLLDASQTVSTRHIREGAKNSYLNNPNYGNPVGR